MGDELMGARRAGDFPEVFLPSAIQSIRPYSRNFYVEGLVPMEQGSFNQAVYDIMDAANVAHVSEVFKKKYGEKASISNVIPIDVRGLVLALQKVDEEIKALGLPRGILELPGFLGQKSLVLGKEEK